MVSFNCDGCGDVVKKPKLDQHYHGRCGAPFTCLDCSTQFHSPGQWKGHTSCISEAEKYERSVYKGPKNAKGKQKQQPQQAAEPQGAAPAQEQAAEPSSSSAPPAAEAAKSGKKDKKRKREEEAEATAANEAGAGAGAAADAPAEVNGKKSKKDKKKDNKANGAGTASSPADRLRAAITGQSAGLTLRQAIEAVAAAQPVAEGKKKDKAYKKCRDELLDALAVRIEGDKVVLE